MPAFRHPLSQRTHASARPAGGEAGLTCPQRTRAQDNAVHVVDFAHGAAVREWHGHKREVNRLALHQVTRVSPSPAVWGLRHRLYPRPPCASAPAREAIRRV